MPFPHTAQPSSLNLNTLAATQVANLHGSARGRHTSLFENNFIASFSSACFYGNEGYRVSSLLKTYLLSLVLSLSSSLAPYSPHPLTILSCARYELINLQCTCCLQRGCSVSFLLDFMVSVDCILFVVLLPEGLKLQTFLRQNAGSTESFV